MIACLHLRDAVMVELADIFRLHGPAYRATFGDRIPASPLRAMQDIAQCRTEALGGHLFACEQCQQHHYSDHSCKNRPCPTCQHDQAHAWVEHQKSVLLPVTPFLVTFTVPEQRRSLTRSHQKTLYNILFRASSAAFQALALDPRFLGGRIGRIGVLHTWTRALLSHPHIHYSVPGGALSVDGTWRPSRQDVLVHVKPLAVLFRAKFADQLHKTALGALVDAHVWDKAWVVHCVPVGSGEHAFRSLARYLFRVAISHNRILTLEDGHVTFQYQESATDQRKTCPLTAQECIRRFLQHVLPH